MLKVFELFAGIGAPTMALKALNIKIENVGISEIENLSVQGYYKLHGEVKNYGDIREITEPPVCDFIHASSPCKSFSRPGKRDGLSGESGLILDFYRIMEYYYKNNCLPTYVSFENVPDLQIYFPKVYQQLLDNLDKWGYNSYSSVLKAYDFGNPTRRERLFVIGIRKDKDNGKFKMPEPTERATTMAPYLLNEVNKKFFVKEGTPFRKSEAPRRNIGQRIGYLVKSVDKPKQDNLVYDRNDIAPTITAASTYYYIEDKGSFRRLVPEELWGISGYSKEDWEKIKSFSDFRIDQFIGNSIALGPLKAIYSNLKEAFNWEEN